MNELPTLKTELTFHANTVTPSYDQTPKNDWQFECLIYNRCDGYHLVCAAFDMHTHEFDCFTNWMGTETYDTDFYIAWALLPEGFSVLAPVFDLNNGESDE